MKAPRARLRRVRNGALRWLLPLLTFFLGAVSWSTAQAVGRAIGSLAFRLGKRDRSRSLEHLEMALPALSDDQRREIALASFRSHGMNLTESLHLLRRDLAAALSHLTIEGWEHVEAVGRRPLLVVTGHCGNWELFSPAFQSRGRSLAAVVRPLDEAWAEKLATRIRRRFGTTVIRRGSRDSVGPLRRVMRGGQALIMLIDQDVRVDSVWVPFFGRLARTPSGAAEIALRRDMAVVPAFCIRRSDGSHVARFLPALELPPDVTEATALMTRAIEEHVRAQPDQWVWMHRRWRHRPPPAAGDSGAESTRAGGLV